VSATTTPASAAPFFKPDIEASFVKEFDNNSGGTTYVYHIRNTNVASGPVTVSALCAYWRPDGSVAHIAPFNSYTMSGLAENQMVTKSFACDKGPWGGMALGSRLAATTADDLDPSNNHAHSKGFK
jgi:hypothetical protein